MSRESFLPALRLLRDAVLGGEGRFRVGVVATGPLLRSARKHNAPLLRAMRQLNETEGVEWVASPADASVLSLGAGRAFPTAAFQAGRRTGGGCSAGGRRRRATQGFLYDNTHRRPRGVGRNEGPCCAGLRRPLPSAARTANQVFRPAGGAEDQGVSPPTSASATTGGRASATATGPATRSRPRLTPTGSPAAWRPPAARFARSFCT